MGYMYSFEVQIADCNRRHQHHHGQKLNGQEGVGADLSHNDMCLITCRARSLVETSSPSCLSATGGFVGARQVHLACTNPSLSIKISTSTSYDASNTCYQ